MYGTRETVAFKTSQDENDMDWQISMPNTNGEFQNIPHSGDGFCVCVCSVSYLLTAVHILRTTLNRLNEHFIR